MNAECPMPKNNAKWWGTEKEREEEKREEADSQSKLDIFMGL